MHANVFRIETYVIRDDTQNVTMTLAPKPSFALHTPYFMLCRFDAEFCHKAYALHPEFNFTNANPISTYFLILNMSSGLCIFFDLPTRFAYEFFIFIFLRKFLLRS